MKKTLIIVCHPNIQDSTINKAFMQTLKNHQQFTIHHLDTVYPDGQINIEKEQALVEAHDHLVFQFPIYWFNCPPLLKHWLDQVLSYGWAYGRQGIKLKNKKIGIAVSTGIREQDYYAQGRYHHSLEEILRPFEMTIDYVGGQYQSFFAAYGIHLSPDDMPTPDKEYLQQITHDYLKFLSSF